jgi:hypothetical protein
MPIKDALKIGGWFLGAIVLILLKPLVVILFVVVLVIIILIAPLLKALLEGRKEVLITCGGPIPRWRYDPSELKIRHAFSDQPLAWSRFEYNPHNWRFFDMSIQLEGEIFWSQAGCTRQNDKPEIKSTFEVWLFGIYPQEIIKKWVTLAPIELIKPLAAGIEVIELKEGLQVELQNAIFVCYVVFRQIDVDEHGALTHMIVEIAGWSKKVENAAQ